MRPQLQSVVPAGGFGDCHRTCIAMILDLHKYDVPHFMEHVPPGLAPQHPLSVEAEQAERDWLAQRGLSIINVPLDGSADLDLVLTTVSAWARDTAVILGGVTASGRCHSVVCYGGRIYDPLQQTGCTLIGPQPSGFWYVTIYAHATDPLPPAPEPGSVVMQEDD